MNSPHSLDSLKIQREHAPPPRRGPLIIAILVLLLVGASGAAAWRFWPKDGVPVHVAIAETDAGTAGSTLDATGYVVARRQATLSAKIQGKLVEANLEEGERITTGQVVARLDDSNYRAALTTARAQAKLAEAALANAAPVYQRYQKLHDAGAISEDMLSTQKTLYDAARTSLDVARAGVAQAAANEADTIVRAPFAGIVTDKVAQVGEIVSPAAAGGGNTRTGIATIVDMDSLEVDVDVSENYIDRVTPGQKATIVLDAYPDWQIPASVIAIIPTADQSKGTVKVRVAIGVKDTRILPQMGARVSFLSTAKTAEISVPHAVTIPVKAVQGVGENASVYLIKEDGTIEIRSVTTGAKKGTTIAIRAGLQPGERVVIDNFDKLSEGVKVAVAE